MGDALEDTTATGKVVIVTVIWDIMLNILQRKTTNIIKIPIMLFGLREITPLTTANYVIYSMYLVWL